MNQKHFQPAQPLMPDTSNGEVKFFSTGFNKLEMAALLCLPSVITYRSSAVLLNNLEDIARSSVLLAEAILDRCDIEREKFIMKCGRHNMGYGEDSIQTHK